MSFLTIDWNKIKVGDPITKELMDIFKNNFDDLDQRLNSVETVGGAYYLFNGDINLRNFSSLDPYVFYLKITKNILLTEVRAQIFDKGSVSTGTLSLDVQKSIDTNNANFATVMSSQVSFNFATDTSYSVKTGTINSSVSSIANGSVLRVEVTGIPAGYFGKVLLFLGAE